MGTPGRPRPARAPGTTRPLGALRPLRALKTAALGLLLPAALLTAPGALLAGPGAGTAHAAPGDELVRVSTDAPGRFQIKPLNKAGEYADAIAAIKASPGITPLPDPLGTLAGTGHQGKAGTCYPAAFHPGADASGYCWNNEDDATGGPVGWTPQGLSPRVDRPSWQVASWHSGDNKFARLTFVDRSAAAPRFNHVLLVTPGGTTGFSALASHADSIVWKGDRLLLGSGRYVFEFDARNLMRVNTQDERVGIVGGNASAKFHNYILPISETYISSNQASEACLAGEGAKDVPGTASGTCVTSLSYSGDGRSLVSSEYVPNASGGRIVQWPDLKSGAATTATAVWRSPVHSMQGALLAEGSLFISGKCPASFDNGGEIRYKADGTPIPRENACIHKAAPGGAPSVLTAVPDMTQNLAYDPAEKRVWGISERYFEVRNRLVFSVAPTVTPVTAVRFKNIGSDKCLAPYGALIKPGINATQWDCNGKSPQNWYWDGRTIRNFSSRLCLTVEGASDSNGAQITQWTCNGSPYQDWTLRASAAGGAQIVSDGSKLCLTSHAGSAGNGANIVQWACDPTQIKHSWNGG
ncbi:RICIN domain-containing protein [Streptomyces sp. NPDC050504]|uniref:RICIN domain-containing protein n=1 Tax=Streptomyces sp. NPDC050504 TaxID=3365618 RepID=UPI0037A361E7